MWYSQDNNQVYFGDKANWQDIALSGERPSPYHYPVIENGRHTGEWFFADFQEAFMDKQSEIVQKFKAAMTPITGIYTSEDIASFPTQEAEAKAYLADSNADTPFIDGLLANRPTVDKPTLVQRIIDNASDYKTVAGPAIGKKQYYDDQLYALKAQHADPEQPDVTKADIDAIVVDYS
jgi:hypothetical protein